MGAAETGVSALFEKAAAAWGTNDGAAFAACYTADGSLINPFGERADGRADLTGMYTGYFSGMLAGTSTSITLTQLRSIGTEYALADAEQAVYSSGGEVLLALHVVNLMQRDGDGWLIVDSRPYAFSEAPG